MAQLAELPTLDFCSGHDLMVREIKPCAGLHADSAEPAWNSLFSPLSPPLSLTLSLSQKLLFFCWKFRIESELSESMFCRGERAYVCYLNDS